MEEWLWYDVIKNLMFAANMLPQWVLRYCIFGAKIGNSMKMI